MAPVLWSGICLLVVLAGQLTTMAVPGPEGCRHATGWLGLFFFALTPYGFLFGLLRSRVVQAGAVSELLRKMGETPDGTTLRDLLSRALGDPLAPDRLLARRQADLGRRRRTRGRAAGRRRPGARLDGDRARGPARRRRSCTTLACCEDAELVRSVAAAAGLSIQNERLQAQLRARVGGTARFARADRRGRHCRAAPPGAQPARRRPAAARRAVADAAAGAGPLRKDPDGPRAARERAGRAQLALEELRELARGIHPAVLSDRGLGRRSRRCRALAGPVTLDRTPPDRLPAPVEAAAYFVVAEALTNVAKYAQASQAHVSVSRRNGHAIVEVADDGVGGADPGRGSGLSGLADRIGALDGRLALTSPEGAGTLLRAEIPV
jgi:hypothetical protein